MQEKLYESCDMPMRETDEMYGTEANESYCLGNCRAISYDVTKTP